VFDEQTLVGSSPSSPATTNKCEFPWSNDICRYSEQFDGTTSSYKVDVVKMPGAKKGANVTQVPTILIFKDGAEVHRAEPKDPESMKKIGEIVSA